MSLMLVNTLQLFKGLVTEANNILHDLQDGLNSQETKLTAYAQKQREVGISNLIWRLFEFLLIPSVKFI